jgi:hypothetical protein
MVFKSFHQPNFDARRETDTHLRYPHQPRQVVLLVEFSLKVGWAIGSEHRLD